LLIDLPALHCGVMNDSAIEAKPANPKADEWAERIAAQRRSGVSVKQFCKEQGLTEYSFYAWRKRLQQTDRIPHDATTPPYPTPR
jgi:hypothetical protein